MNSPDLKREFAVLQGRVRAPEDYAQPHHRNPSMTLQPTDFPDDVETPLQELAREISISPLVKIADLLKILTFEQMIQLAQELEAKMPFKFEEGKEPPSLYRIAAWLHEWAKAQHDRT